MLCGRVGEHENMRKSSHANWWSSKMFSWIIRRCKSLPTVCKPFCARKKNVTDGSSRHCCATWSSKESAKAQNSFCWFIMLMLCHHRDEASFTRQDYPPFFKSLRDSTECDFCRHVCFHEFIHIPRRWNIRLAFLCPLLHIYHWKTMWRVHSGISRVVNYEHTQINSLSIVNK